ncbi:MAG TPA: hypothetical protein VFN26_23895 [Candidatus Acidoferrum sp.]|nr:hypothetical protein [Candidatus Acidoferrum sp.]
MSWDLLAFRAPVEFKSPRTEDLPQGWEPAPFGLRSEVQAQLRVLLPGVQFSFVKDSLWGTWSDKSCSLEISLGDVENITYLWIAARGESGEALPTISFLLDALNLRGVDLQRGEFFDLKLAHQSFQQWRESVEGFRSTIKPKGE